MDKHVSTVVIYMNLQTYLTNLLTTLLAQIKTKNYIKSCNIGNKSKDSNKIDALWLLGWDIRFMRDLCWDFSFTNKRLSYHSVGSIYWIYVPKSLNMSK